MGLKLKEAFNTEDTEGTPTRSGQAPFTEKRKR